MEYQSQIIIGNPNTILEHILPMTIKILGSSKLETHPDYYHINQTEKLSIGVQEAKQIIEFAKKKPYQSEGKVIYINRAHKLTHQAQNALLKTLEEPPQNTLILLGAETKLAFLETVLSRCKLVELGNIITINTKVPRTIEESLILIHKLNQIKIPREKRDAAKQLLMSLVSQKRQQLNTEKVHETTRKKIAKQLKLINNTNQQIDSNANLRLALESLFIKLDNLN